MFQVLVNANFDFMGKRNILLVGSLIVVAVSGIVLAVNGLGLVCKAETMQRCVQPIAAAITGKHAPGAIGAVRGGREADDEQARMWVAEAGYRPAPVGVFTEAAGWFVGRRLAMCHEPAASTAVTDGPVERFDGLQDSSMISIVSGPFGTTQMNSNGSSPCA